MMVRPHNLSGNIKSDLALVDKKDVLNFDDVESQDIREIEKKNCF